MAASCGMKRISSPSSSSSSSSLLSRMKKRSDGDDGISGRGISTTAIIPAAVILYGVLLTWYHATAEASASSFSPPLSTTDNNSSNSADSIATDEEGNDGGGLLGRMTNGPDYLTPMDCVFFGTLILLAFELLNYLTKNGGRWFHCKLIPVRGKHLDELSQKDVLFIGMNKAATAPFVYFYIRYAFYESNVIWDLGQITMMNVVVPIPVIFIVYDFFYTLLHWFLHIKAIYGYIHKHHHHQKAPSRANVDAVNVHPIEFFLGEYNHLLALFLCCRVFHLRVHVVTAVLFLAIGGALAGLNHTRYDVAISLPFGSLKLYDTKVHDVHHRIPQSNYGQYVMFWDYLFGSYRPYNENDRVNPKAQLDPRTGKSIEYTEAKKLAAKVD